MSTKDETENEDNSPCGQIAWNDPMISSMIPTLYKGFFYYGFKGLLNFGRVRKPTNKFVQQSINRINTKFCICCLINDYKQHTMTEPAYIC